MASIKFDFKSVKKLPSRRYAKKSRYDPILDQFLKSSDNLWQVNVEGMDANYLRTQIMKRIRIRDLEDTIKVSVVNNIVYLERI